MAVSVEVKRRTFKLEINFGEEVDEGEAEIVKDVALSFMESRACEEEDVPDGVYVADKLHTAAVIDHDCENQHANGNGVGWKIGKLYAHWGDSLFKDKKSKDQLQKLLADLLGKTIESGGSLFLQALKAILCDKCGLVSEIRIERLASVFKLCWDVFKLALLNYAVDKAFEVLGYILTYLIKFLQDSKFFTVLRQIGGWECMQQMVAVVPYKPHITQGIKYLSIAAVAMVIGGAAVYLYMKKTN